jgi:hypothetical protein
MVKHISHNVFRNALSIEAAVDDNLLERRIETSKLRSPRARAPAQGGSWKGVSEIPAIQAVEERFEVVEVSRRPVFCTSCPALAHEQKPAACGPRVGKLPV